MRLWESLAYVIAILYTGPFSEFGICIRKFFFWQNLYFAVTWSNKTDPSSLYRSRLNWTLLRYSYKMDNNNYRHSANVSPGGSSINWTNDKLGVDPFESQNFYYDNIANGTTKEVFDRRNVIDRKNLVEVFISKFGIKWVSNLISNATFVQVYKMCII